ncbi:MAG: Trk system potassium transporter TrkA [Pseudomonadota bacterium]|jgi:trk system potassium uptake protein TrkA|nr:Trk system potassium transporter TrkA [Pseudomonadota bacterium]MEC8716852.1 Trk system potassium transporter TrkA [Pseudomonadota bacterium]MED5443564.1 Trk system potassium transporter TrkA [Pseudomonadota bacterium]
MKILILGAGQVGGTLAENLASENFDITLVDTNGDRLRELRDRLDIQTIEGMASRPDVLRAAGAQDADMLVAVTNSDEVNMVACQVSFSLFKTPTKIARIRASAYTTQAGGLFSKEHMPIDVLINPEQVVTEHIERLIQFPGALQVLDFARGRAQLVAVKAYEDGPLVGQALATLREHVPGVDTRVAAIFRRDRAIMPQGDTVIEADDEVFFIAAKRDITAVMSELRGLEAPYKRIVIAGGGHIGERLAKVTAKGHHVKIIEYDADRAMGLADALDGAVVIQGDATDGDLLTNENIERTDVFCALTNDDEANIMSSMLAKRLGARKVMTLISKPAYVDLVQGGVIDVAISPQQATISELLAYVRRGDVARVHSLRRGAAEAMEAIAHGDSHSSKVVGRRLDEIRLPPGASIGALVRGDDVLIAHDSVVVESDDHVLLFLTDKRQVRAVENLFQVGLNFF